MTTPLNIPTTPNNKAKILRNADWSNLTNTLDNINFNTFDNPGFHGGGISIPNDSLQTPHRAYVDEIDNNNILIGEPREEEWYPYIDTVNYEYKKLEIDIVQSIPGGDYDWIIAINEEPKNYVISFPTATEITPSVPEDLENGVVYGYTFENNWEYEEHFVFDYTNSEGVTIPDGLLKIFLTNRVQANENGIARFEDDTVVTTFNVEYLSGTINDDLKTSELITLEEILSGAPEISAEMADIDDAVKEYSIWNTSAYVPVGISWFDLEDNYIDRNVQLLIGNPSLSVGSSNTVPSSATVFRHPFKGTVSGENIYIGADRAEDTYEFKDNITIYDPVYHEPVVITKATKEEQEITESSWVYYDIYKSTSNVWTADLSANSNWPPTTKPDRTYLPIGYATFGDLGESISGVVKWGQELYDCPVMHPYDPRGEFGIEYKDGVIGITSGNVFAFGSNGIVDGSQFGLGTTGSVWVEITSEQTSGLPNVTINSTLQSGSYPGFQLFDGTDLQINYKLGSFSAGKFIPSHANKSITIGNTLLNPLVPTEFQGDEEYSIKYMTHDEDSMPYVPVGNSSNDTLFKSSFVDHEIIGGGVNKLGISGDFEVYGLTIDNDEKTVDWTIDDNSLTIISRNLSSVYDHGLLQEFEVTDADELVIEGGDAINLDQDGDVININFDFDAIEGDELWITQVQNPNLLITTHLPPPGVMEHWSSFMAKEEDGESDLLVSLDNTGHTYLLSGETSGVVTPPGTPSTSAYLYTECEGSDTLVNGIHVGDFIWVNSKCWEFDSVLFQNAGSIEGIVQFDSCESCLSGTSGANEIWNDCDTDLSASYITAGEIPSDYAWLCLSNIWVKCYYSGTETLCAPIDPNYLTQCGSEPISCSDLIGAHASDNFSGSGCNSNIVNDDNWTIRWTVSNPYPNGITYTINSEALDLDGSGIDRNEGTQFVVNLDSADYDQDWIMELDITPNFVAGGQDGGPDCVIILSNGDNFGHLSYGANKESGPGWYTRINGVRTLRVAGFASKTVKLEFTESTGTLEYFIGGVSYGTRVGQTITELEIYSANEVAHDGNRVTLDYTVDNWVLTDGASGAIYIDPTGTACT